MQTKQEGLLDVLGAPNTQFVIPAYQRAYAWQQRQCNELWLDLMRAARADARHFLGTLPYAPEAPGENGQARLAVVDGQQRLTTVTLVLTALARHLRETGATAAGLSAADIEARYLLASGVSEASGAPAPAGSPDASAGDTPACACKLVLSRADRATLAAVVADDQLPAEASRTIVSNLAFFAERMNEDGFDPNRLMRGLRSLFVICARIDGTDHAQLIFESLNSKGVPLTTADLVRNYLLIAESRAQQAYLHREYWAPIEGMFAPDPGSLRLDNAIQGWLSVRFRKVRAHGAGEVYSVFKQYVEDEFTGTTEDLLRELRGFCLVWAENYRYHAVKKYKSAFSWATNGAGTLTQGYALKKSDNEEYAEKVRRDLRAVDASK